MGPQGGLPREECCRPCRGGRMASSVMQNTLHAKAIDDVLSSGKPQFPVTTPAGGRESIGSQLFLAPVPKMAARKGQGQHQHQQDNRDLTHDSSSFAQEALPSYSLR